MTDTFSRQRAEENSADEVTFTYTNYKGVTAKRRVRPIKLKFGSTEFHPKQQWLLDAWDCDKRSYRTFAMADIREWAPVDPTQGVP